MSDLISQYFEYLENERATRTKESAYGFTGKMFRASGIGYCSRKQVYKALKTEQRPRNEAFNEFSMYIGTSIHEILQDQWMKAGIIRDIRDEYGKPSEIEIINDEYDFSGHIDAIYDNDDGIGVADFKTTNNLGFLHYSVSGNAKKAHIEQVMLYAGELGANEVKLIYINTNGLVPQEKQKMFIENGWNQRFKEITLPFNPALYNSSLEKLRQLKEYVVNYPETQELPPKVNTSDCSYCEFHWCCKARGTKIADPKKDDKPMKIMKTF